jgi:hypothetical protein
MSTRYDPLILQKFADRLYSQADSVVILCVILGVAIGGIGGFQIGAGIGAVVGLVIFGALGFAIGLSIAFQLKLRAQSVLCQKQIEENTRQTVARTLSGKTSEEVVVSDEEKFERWKQSRAVQTSASRSQASEKAVDDLSIPCPKCGQHLKVSTLKQGENWCTYCFEKFIAQ